MANEVIVKSVENLKGELFEGILKNGKAEVIDNREDLICADYVATFEDFKNDGFSLENLLEYVKYIRRRKPLKGKGYSFSDYVHVDISDEEISDNYEDEDGKYFLFFNLEINIKEFDGDFKKLSKEIDKYVSGYKKKYDAIKATVSEEQKKEVKKITNHAKKVFKVIPEIFTQGKVVNTHREWYRSHGTFTSNSTSGGTYSIEYPNKGLTQKDIENRFYHILNNIKIVKPSGSIYSSITGASKDLITSMLKNKEYTLTKQVIRFDNLPYEDLFIGD